MSAIALLIFLFLIVAVISVFTFIILGVVWLVNR